MWVLLRKGVSKEVIVKEECVRTCFTTVNLQVSFHSESETAFAVWLMQARDGLFWVNQHL